MRTSKVSGMVLECLVFAAVAGGWSQAEAQVVPPPGEWVTPPGLQGTAVTPSSIEWTWTPSLPAPGIQMFGYVIGDPDNTVRVTDLLAPTTTSFTEGNRQENTQYRRFVLPLWTSDLPGFDRGIVYGGPASLTVAKYTFVAGHGLTATASSPTSVSVKVEPPPNSTEGQTGCEIMRNGVVIKPYSSVYTCDDTGLQPDTQYQYTAHLRNGDAKNEVSANPYPVTVTTPSAVAVDFSFKNGAFLGYPRNGYICVPTNMDKKPIAEGTERLTVSVTRGGIPVANVKVRVSLKNTKVFYFKSVPDAVSIVKPTDTAGATVFEFAAKNVRGETSLTLDVFTSSEEPEFTETAIVRSFILVSEMITHRTSAQVVDGSGMITEHAATPPATGPNVYALGGGRMQCMAVTDNPGTSVEATLIEVAITFRVTAEPGGSWGEVLTGQLIEVYGYIDRIEFRAGPFRARVTKYDPENVVAKTGYHLSIARTHVGGVEPEAGFPELDPSVLCGVNVPRNPPTIGRRPSLVAVLTEGGAKRWPGTKYGETVLMRVNEEASVTCSAYIEATARGADAIAMGDFDLRRLFIAMSPGPVF